jgi:Ca-activated chloride channel family protein
MLDLIAFGMIGKVPIHTRVLDVQSALPDEGNRGLRYLWARSRIAELSDYGASDVGEEGVREITQLGLKYNLLTPYTSFIAVREKIVNPNGDQHDVNQPLPLPLGVSDMAIGSEPELVWMLMIAGLFVMILVVRRYLAWVSVFDRTVK